MADATVHVTAELDNAVVVRPGDTLVVGLSEALTESQAERIKDRIASRLPGVRAVLISGCTALAVYRADAPRIEFDRPIGGDEHVKQDGQAQQ